MLADRTDRRTLLASGFVVLILADVALASAGGVEMVMIGAALWGLHMGLTQGLLATLVANASPSELRGSAFSLFNLVSGLMLLVASVIAGALWHGLGAPTTFLTGAVFTILALVGLFLRPPRDEASLPSRRSTLG